MRPSGRALAGVLLLLTLAFTTGTGCAKKANPGAQPAATPSATATATTPTPTPPVTTPGPSPSGTSPGTGWTTVSARVAYQWRWPNADNPATVSHTYQVPPVPELVTIGVGNHPNDPGDRPYNRMSFSFTTGFPSYHFQFVDQLVADGSGKPIPLAGNGVLRIVFVQAQAHTANGTASTIVSQPAARLGLSRMVAYAQAGDFEGYLSYGIGIGWPNAHSNPQIQVRVYEVTYVNTQGVYRYVVAVDVDAR
jgi:hypothetical protein